MTDQPPPWAGNTLAEFDELKRLQDENRDLILAVALLETRVAELERSNDASALAAVRITRLEAQLLALAGQLHRA